MCWLSSSSQDFLDGVLVTDHRSKDAKLRMRHVAVYKFLFIETRRNLHCTTKYVALYIVIVISRFQIPEVYCTRLIHELTKLWFTIFLQHLFPASRVRILAINLSDNLFFMIVRMNGTVLCDTRPTQFINEILNELGFRSPFSVVLACRIL